MDTREAIKGALEMANFVSMGYLEDLSDAELLHRPAPGCNHINWQIGHLVVSEHRMMSGIVPGAMPPLPDGLDAKYTPETAPIDDPAKFATKAELLKVAGEQRSALLAALAKTSDVEFDKPTGIEYAPTVGAMYNLQPAHWLMHAGQWAVVRRQLGRKPLF